MAEPKKDFKLNKKRAESFLRDGNLPERLTDASKGLLSDSGVPVYISLFYLLCSVFAPMLAYSSSACTQFKRAQEHVFVLGDGGIGIDWVWNLMKNCMFEWDQLDHITAGALTANDENYAKQISFKPVFFPELLIGNPNLVKLLKSLIENNYVKAVRTVKGLKPLVMDVYTYPAIYVGTNCLTRLMDKQFISRFDSFFTIKGNLVIWKEIKKIQISSVGNIPLLTSPNSNMIFEDIKHALCLLKSIQEKKSFANKRYSYFVTDFDDVRELMDEETERILDSYPNVASIVSRDVEICLRRTNTSAWLNIFNRETYAKKLCRGQGKILCIKANLDDAKLGIDSFKKSLEAKDKLFRERARKSTRERKVSARRYYLANYDKLKGLSLRKQAEEVSKATGESVSHVICGEWQRQLLRADKEDGKDG
jgi:hypothetical protein